MPQAVRLTRQYVDQFRVAVAEAIDCYPHSKIEITLTIFSEQIGTFATFKIQIPSSIVLHECRAHIFILIH